MEDRSDDNTAFCRCSWPPGLGSPALRTLHRYLPWKVHQEFWKNRHRITRRITPHPTTLFSSLRLHASFSLSRKQQTLQGTSVSWHGSAKPLLAFTVLSERPGDPSHGRIRLLSPRQARPPKCAQRKGFSRPEELNFQKPFPHCLCGSPPAP